MFVVPNVVKHLPSSVVIVISLPTLNFLSSLLPETLQPDSRAQRIRTNARKDLINWLVCTDSVVEVCKHEPTTSALKFIHFRAGSSIVSFKGDFTTRAQRTHSFAPMGFQALALTPVSRYHNRYLRRISVANGITKSWSLGTIISPRPILACSIQSHNSLFKC